MIKTLTNLVTGFVLIVAVILPIACVADIADSNNSNDIHAENMVNHYYNMASK